MRQLPLEQLFAIAQDAEVGLAGRGGRRGQLTQEGGVVPSNQRNARRRDGGVTINAFLADGDKGGTGQSKPKRTENVTERRCDREDNRNAGSRSGGSRHSGDTLSTSSSSSGGRGATGREGTSKCFICDRTGHGWANCPSKKTGKGCFRCGSEGHQFAKCPQRQNSGGGGWDMSWPINEGRSTTSIFVMETHVMGVEGAPEGSKLLYYPVSVRKYEVQALLDSGASVNCIDADLADRAGGVITRRASGILLYPDKRRADVRGIADIEVRGKGYREKVTFWVVKGLGVQMLLGEPWLRSWNPAINWKTKELVFSDGVVWKAAGSDHTLKTGLGRKRLPGERQVYLMVNGVQEGEEEKRG